MVFSAPFPVLFLAASLLCAPSHALERQLFQYERTTLTRTYVNTLATDDQLLIGFEDTPVVRAKNITAARCRYGPDDGKWPSAKAWTRLAKQLSNPNGLITTVPQASPCYPGDNQDDAVCQRLTANWTNSYTHVDDPTEILSPVYQGLTCQPPAIYNSRNCTLGGYPSYVIDVNKVLDIQVGLNFARNNGIRLIVKNTGHDFSGKSVGAGSLSMWTHHLKDITYYGVYQDASGYTGPAFKAGAGVQAYEIYKAANDHNVVVVAGEGQTVGVFGGYILGGGHSPLSGLYGMAADHVLSFEVVTPAGDFITADSTQNSDLYWALRGGGGSTFGVVTSVTVKAYPEMPVTAVTLSYNTTKSVSHNQFWEGFRAYVEHMPQNADAGTYTYFSVMSTGADLSFNLAPFFAPNKTLNETNKILSPYFSSLTRNNIPINPQFKSYKTFYEAWKAEFPLEPQSDVQSAYASRLFPHASFSGNAANATYQVFRDTAEAGATILGFNVNPNATRYGRAIPDTSINPIWRDTVLHAITGRRWNTTSTTSDILAARKSFTNGTMQRWRDASPNSGAYLNEADRLEPNWQQSFWGSNYARLASIKSQWDKKNVFYAVNAVGSEDWRVESVDGLPNENGKLCKISGPISTTSSRVRATPTAMPTA